MTSLPGLLELAARLGGEVSAGQVLCPGPGHTPIDRSLSVKPDTGAPDGFVVYSHSGDDVIQCRDHVRAKLGMAPFAPKKRRNGNGAGTDATVATYTYVTAANEPYLQVHRTTAKQFYQYHWTGTGWAAGAPRDPKIPYRLPELAAAGATMPVYVVEGEKDADALGKLGFVATCNSGGADNGSGKKWTKELSQHFKNRNVYIIPDNDEVGRVHATHVAKNLDKIAASVRIVTLPGLEPKGDVSDFLTGDPTGARFVKLAKAAPLWEPKADSDTGASAGKSDDELIAELAALPRLQYEKRREKAADKLGIRVSALDELVAKARGDKEEEGVLLYPHWALERWVEPVDGEVALAGVVDALKRYVVMSEEQALAVALWCMFTWLHEVAVHSPILLVTSPVHDSGKSTLLKVVSFLSRNGLTNVHITGPALFRSIDKWLPTFCLDEADKTFVSNDDLGAVVNSGWTRGDGIIRCDPETNEPRNYSTFCPKAIGLIGRKLSHATLSRSLIIAMRRKRPDEHADDFEHIDNEAFARLRSQLMRWAEDNAEPLAKARPETPPGLYNRTRMNWHFLLAIAERCGAKQAVWKAVQAIEEVRDASDPALGLQLLTSIRAAFDALKTDKLTTKTLIAELCKDETAPWATYNYKNKDDKSITERQLAGLLKEYNKGLGIKPTTLRTPAGALAKGYYRRDFEDDFASYIPFPTKTASSCVTVQQTSDLNGLELNLSVTDDTPVTDKNASNPLEDNTCCDVTDREPVFGDEGICDDKLSSEDCAQCGARDGTAHLYTIKGTPVWLHRECVRFFEEGSP